MDKVAQFLRAAYNKSMLYCDSGENDDSSVRHPSPHRRLPLACPFIHRLFRRHSNVCTKAIKYANGKTKLYQNRTLLVILGLRRDLFRAASFGVRSRKAYAPDGWRIENKQKCIVFRFISFLFLTVSAPSTLEQEYFKRCAYIENYP